jgi:hypothetical protein
MCFIIFKTISLIILMAFHSYPEKGRDGPDEPSATSSAAGKVPISSAMPER